MQKLLLLGLFLAFSCVVSPSQSLDNSIAQDPNQNPAVDCSDPAMAGSPQCSAQAQGSNNTQGENSATPVRTPVLTPPAGSTANQYSPGRPPLNPSQSPAQFFLRPRTEFEQMVADSVGRPLPLFGQSLFQHPPSTFSPVDWMQVPSDYVIGPGDELQINIWGQVEANLRVVVDRAGQIYIPRVGEIQVAGLHYKDLEQDLKQQISKIFKNFDLTVDMGHLRSLQVFVVGNARYPGTYTISSLSTLVNAIFASGGPDPQGSLRHIQVRRDGAIVTDFDFYDLIIKGDKSKDVRLQPGDVIYYPPVGPLVAISGSVNTPAIYEMKENSTLNDLIVDAGDLSTVADTSKVTVDRLVDHQARKTMEFSLDAQSRALPLMDGDIVHVLSIVPRFEDTVTLRGNVANPGRYPWTPGMRIRDLIPNAQALLTRHYWRNRADIVNGRATEYPIPEVPQTNFIARPEEPAAGMEGQSPTYGTAGGTTTAPNQNPAEYPAGTSNISNAAGAGYPQNEPNPSVAETGTAEAGPGQRQPSPQISESSGNTSGVTRLVDQVRSYAPEINWDYAIIQRVNPVDLTSKLIWLNPRKAIIEHDEASNLELKPGDIVTIFSQRDISVPQADRAQYVIVEGEVMRPGIYKLQTNETLRSVLQRAGGLTPDAYVYGAQLTRESARVAQQKSIDELAHTMELQIRQSAVVTAASSNPGDLQQSLAAQEAIITQLRSTRASGRVALPVNPTDKSVNDFPDMVMEDGDRLLIPHVPSTVSVVGDVYNPGSFIFESRNSVRSYLDVAGKGKPQSDLRHAFVLRANGIVVAATNVNGLFRGAEFNRVRLYPGDQIVVPYKLPTGAFVRGIRDWTQISSQMALTAAALAVILP